MLAKNVSGSIEFWRHLSQFGWARSSLSNAPMEEKLQNLLFKNFNSSKIGVVKVLRPLTVVQAKQNSMSSFIGTGAQPLHTDCAYQSIPPRFVLLKCISKGEHQCPTNIGEIMWRRLETDRPAEIYDAVWTFWNHLSHSFYSTIVHGVGDQARMRFDPFCMKLAGNIKDSNSLSGILLKYMNIRSEYLNDGEWLLINNWRVVHGRGLGAELSPTRRIERSYWS